MGRFLGLSGVKTNQGGMYFEAGDYVVDLNEVKLVRTRKAVVDFIIAAKVVESTCANRGPGCMPAQHIQLKPEYLETALANIKAFLAAAWCIENPDEFVPTPQHFEDYGLARDANEDPVADFWDKLAEKTSGPTQPLKGLRIKLNCTQIKTRQNKDFTKHVWGPVIGFGEATA